MKTIHKAGTILLILLTVFIVVVGALHHASTVEYSGYQMIRANTISPLEEYTAEAEDDRVTIRHIFGAPSETRSVLLFRIERENVDVTLDEEPLFTLGSETKLRPNSVSGYGIVHLPPVEAGQTLEIVLSQLGDTGADLPEFYLGTPSEALVFLLRMDVYGLALGAMLIFLALFMGVLSVIAAVKRLRRRKAFCAALQLLCIAAWSTFDLKLFGLVGISVPVHCAISYFSFMMMPCMIAAYGYCFGEKRGERYLHVIMMISYQNIVVQGILYAMNVAALSQMLIVTHILLVLASCGSLLCRFRANREEPSGEARIGVALFAICVATVVISIAAFLFGGEDMYRKVFLSGVSLYALCILVDAAYSMENSIKRTEVLNAERDVYRDMATRDSLTGLYNRKAFDMQMDALHTVESETLLLFLDLNYLKQTNDLYGHAVGDDLLVRTAHVIRETFEPNGICYRIGGDEYAVILTDPEYGDDRYLELLEENVEHHNLGVEIPVSVSKGLSRLKAGRHTEKDLSEWKTMADKRMYRDKMKMKTALESAATDEYGDMLKGLITSLESRDPFLEGHSHRVTKLTEIICDIMDLSENEKNCIAVAAEMHNIGEVSIPDAILLKNLPLTEKEWRQMQAHAKSGFDIISRSRALTEPAIIALCHHERYDGQGYPNGTSGEDIPLGSRIIAIADSIDAMMNDRPYRKAYTMDYCRDEIMKNAGKMYDPEICAAVLREWGRIEALINKYRKA